MIENDKIFFVNRVIYVLGVIALLVVWLTA
jgi:hypothetical protein